MNNSTLITRTELAKRWRVDTKTVDRMRQAKLLVWIDISGGRNARPIVRFTEADVVAFEERGTYAATTGETLNA